MIEKTNGYFKHRFDSLRDFSTYIATCVLITALVYSVLALLLVSLKVPMFLEPNKLWFSPDLQKVAAPEHKYWLNLFWNLTAIPFVAFIYIRSFAVRDIHFKPQFKIWMALFFFVLALMFAWMQFSGFHGNDGRLSQGFATTAWGVHLSTHFIFYGFCFTSTQTLFYITDKLGWYPNEVRD